MNTNLIYFQIIDKWEVEYLPLLLITLKMFTNLDKIDILIITPSDALLTIEGLFKLLYLPVKTMVQNSDVQNPISSYENIEKYEKILYLASENLIQRDLSILFDLELEDKIYISEKKGLMLHKNNMNVEKDLLLLDKYIFISEENIPISPKDNSNIIMNYFHGETDISKKSRMMYHLDHILDIIKSSDNLNKIIYNQYTWGDGNILFDLKETLITSWGRGTYKCLNENIYYMAWAGTRHIAIFNESYNNFTSITLNDMDIKVRLLNPALKNSIPEPSQLNLQYNVGNRKLIYFCVFHKKDYLYLLKYLLASIKLFSKIEGDTDFLLFTSVEFMEIVEGIMNDFYLDIKVKFFNFTSQYEAGCARIHIFDYENINYYNKILYLDTDILIQRDISLIFDCLKEDKIYVKREFDIYGAGHGGYFFDFDKWPKDYPSLNSGTLLFMNSPAIRGVFHDIRTHIANLKNYSSIWPNCMDQSFIAYHFISRGMCDIESLNDLVCLTGEFLPKPRELSKDVILHFIWPLGNALHKMNRMKLYMNILFEPK
jgi:hypothetical protein